MTITEPMPAPMGVDDIGLFLPKTKDLADSYMPIGWCLSPELRAQLAERQVTDPHMLIIITHGLNETARYLVPLLAGRCHVAFRHSGLNTVRAVVVWQLENDNAPKLSKLMKRESRSYATSVIEVVDEELNRLRDALGVTTNRYRNCRDRASRLSERLYEIESPAISIPAASVDDIQDRTQILEQMSALQRKLYQLDAEDADSLKAQILEVNQEREAYAQEMNRLNSEIHHRALTGERHLEVSQYLQCGRSESVGELDVIIPAGMFGKSWAITKWLAGLQEWPTAALNNCHLRKRAIGSIPWAVVKLLAPPVKKIAGALYAAPLLLTLVWMRIMRYEKVPFYWLKDQYERSPRAAWQQRGKSFWYYSKKDAHSDDPLISNSELQPRSIWLCWIALPTLAWIVAMSYIAYLLLANTGIYILVGIVSFLVLLTAIGEKTFERVETWLDRRQKARVSRFIEELDAIGCDVVPRSDPDHGVVLPRKRRMVYVLQGAKSKVCKPLEG